MKGKEHKVESGIYDFESNVTRHSAAAREVKEVSLMIQKEQKVGDAE